MKVEYGVFAPNGTLALALGLMALGIGPGDEVIVPDITFAASAFAVILVGATPVFADVTTSNFQVDVGECERELTGATKAIMPVHLYGMMADMHAVNAFANFFNLKVIEDAAQAVGVTYGGQHAGTFGDVGCFSFFADKTITMGEGGYVVCKSEEVYERLKLLRNLGRESRVTFIHSAVGYNLRITDIQAAIGLAQLDKLPEIIKRKRRILSWYDERLYNVKQVNLVEQEPMSDYIPFRVVLFCKDAFSLVKYLSEHGVSPRVSFHPLHLQPCFKQYVRHDKFPRAMYCWEHGVWMPAFPELQEREVDYICDTIKNFYAS